MAEQSVDTSSYVYLAVSPMGWGEGATEAQAIRRCKSHSGWSWAALWRVHPNFDINHWGEIFTPLGHPAIKVRDNPKHLPKHIN